MELKEALDRMEQLQREREALDGSYADLKAQVDAAYDTDDAVERERRLSALLARFAGYIDMERRQSKVAVELVMDAYQHLVREAEKADRGNALS
jgi:hypothetical protein